MEEALSENQVIREGRSYQQDWLPSKQRGSGHREQREATEDTGEDSVYTARERGFQRGQPAEPPSCG